MCFVQHHTYCTTYQEMRVWVSTCWSPFASDLLHTACWCCFSVCFKRETLGLFAGESSKKHAASRFSTSLYTSRRHFVTSCAWFGHPSHTTTTTRTQPGLPILQATIFLAEATKDSETQHLGLCCETLSLVLLHTTCPDRICSET